MSFWVDQLEVNYICCSNIQLLVGPACGRTYEGNTRQPQYCLVLWQSPPEESSSHWFIRYTATCHLPSQSAATAEADKASFTALASAHAHAHPKTSLFFPLAFTLHPYPHKHTNEKNCQAIPLKTASNLVCSADWSARTEMRSFELAQCGRWRISPFNFQSDDKE